MFLSAAFSIWLSIHLASNFERCANHPYSNANFHNFYFLCCSIIYPSWNSSLCSIYCMCIQRHFLAYWALYKNLHKSKNISIRAASMLWFSAIVRWSFLSIVRSSHEYCYISQWTRQSLYLRIAQPIAQNRPSTFEQICSKLYCYFSISSVASSKFLSTVWHLFMNLDW